MPTSILFEIGKLHRNTIYFCVLIPIEESFHKEFINKLLAPLFKY